MSKLIHQALYEFNNKQITITKNKKNNAFANGSYSDINSILQSIRPTLQELGIVIVQTPQVADTGSYLNTKICLKDNGDEYIESNIKLIVDPKSPKALWSLGGAITYTRRYAIVSMLNLEAEDDDFQAGTKDAQNTGNKGIIKTTAKERNVPIVKMMEQLREAHKQNNLHEAGVILEQATDKNHVQVLNLYHELYPEATL